MIIITQEIITKFNQENNIVLKSTQPKLCISIVNRIYHKMLLGIKFDAIKVHQTLVCDGHHRYLASLLAGYNLEKIEYIKTSATKVTEWEMVLFDSEDWDTPAKIKVLNEQDAIFNGIPLESLIAMIDDSNKISDV